MHALHRVDLAGAQQMTTTRLQPTNESLMQSVHVDVGRLRFKYRGMCKLWQQHGNEPPILLHAKQTNAGHVLTYRLELRLHVRDLRLCSDQEPTAPLDQRILGEAVRRFL